jgi:uncharacterized protein YjiS (DUF1127 family)
MADWTTYAFSVCRTAPMLHRSTEAKAGPGENSKKEGRMTPFKSITEKFAAWRRYREAVRELAQLSDRELEDIGVRRGDIPFIAAGAARKAA